MYDDESMDDRAEKLQTEIGLSSLRSLRDSLNREGREKRDGRTVSCRTKWRDFCVTFLLRQLLFSCHLLFSSLFTFHDEWPFLPPFFSMSLQYFAPAFSMKFCRLRLPQMHF